MEELRFYDCTVKLYNDKNYSTTIKLSDSTFQLDFRYNTFNEAYYLTVKDSVGNALASSKLVAPDRVFNIKITDGSAVELCIMFFKLLDNVGVPTDSWADNMSCVAKLIKWETVAET